MSVIARLPDPAQSSVWARRDGSALLRRLGIRRVYDRQAHQRVDDPATLTALSHVWGWVEPEVGCVSFDKQR
jgi:hypothetical protein